MSCSMWDLVPQPGIKPTPCALETQSPIHWTAREVPNPGFLKSGTFITLVTAGEPGVWPARSVLDTVNQWPPLISTCIRLPGPLILLRSPLASSTPKATLAAAAIPWHSLVFSPLQGPSESPHSTRLGCSGPEHDWPRQQLPISFTSPHLHTHTKTKQKTCSIFASDVWGHGYHCQGVYVDSSFRHSSELSVILSLLVVAGGHSVAKVFPDRKLSNDQDCCGKRGQEEEEE